MKALRGRVGIADTGEGGAELSESFGLSRAERAGNPTWAQRSQDLQMTEVRFQLSTIQSYITGAEGTKLTWSPHPEILAPTEPGSTFFLA